MSNQELDRKLHDLEFTTGMNQRYHQILVWRWAFADRAVRIVVGVLAFLGVLLPPTNASSAALSAFLFATAIVLNILDFAGREKHHTDLFRGWSDLRKYTERLRVKVSSRDGSTSARNDFTERFAELLDHRNELDASEPAPWIRLLTACDAAERRAIGGSPTSVPAQPPGGGVGGGGGVSGR